VNAITSLAAFHCQGAWCSHHRLASDDGADPEKRLKIAEKIIDRAVKAGLKEEDVIIDPMAMAVSADPDACRVTLETIRLVHTKFGHNITQGASNISFGLPYRENINSAYMAMSIMYGLTCPIANPEKITGWCGSRPCAWQG
jgi:cobalamin-dependent methionine synthase I